MREYNFDGLAGPTHNYAGLALGNLASMAHRGQVSNPRAGALQGLEKMRRVAELGVGQAVLPPHYRPSVPTLRRLGFAGSDAEVLATAARDNEHLLRLCSSASAMWTANAATVAPSADTLDRRVHFTAANLTAMFHRSLEAATTARVLSAIFADPQHFTVHEPLPGGEHFADEGAANHTRLWTTQGAVQLFAWGRGAWHPAARPQKYPARQSFEASEAVARAHALAPDVALLWQQAPVGIDSGAFHTDVLAVGNANLFLFHEHAFTDAGALIATLTARLGPEFQSLMATQAELPASDAVAAYPFNSQLVSLPRGGMALIAPREAEACAPARRFLERVRSETPVEQVIYLDVNASMNNGGGPACLRLRVVLTDLERLSIKARVFFDQALYEDLKTWVQKHYRDRLTQADLADSALLAEVKKALDELTQLLRLGSIYEFQR